MESIPLTSLNSLDSFEKSIFSLFVEKKFKLSLSEMIKEEKLNFFHQKKTKRNEEILKFAVKAYFKHLCFNSDNKYSKNFFKLKKQLSLKIFGEISSSLGMELSKFIEQSFVDSKKLIIKGNKKILLYNKSPTFLKGVMDFLDNKMMLNYKERREEKIKTIIKNLYNKF